MIKKTARQARSKDKKPEEPKAEIVRLERRTWLVESREPVYRRGQHVADAVKLRSVKVEGQTFKTGTGVKRCYLAPRTI